MKGFRRFMKWTWALLLMISAQHLLAEESDSTALHSELVEMYGQVRANPDSVITQLHLIQQELDTLESPLFHAMVLELTGDYYYTLSKYDSAVYCFNKARYIYQQLNDSVSIAINSVYLAEVYIETSEHESAALHLFSAQEYFESANDIFGLMDVYFSLSMLYYDRFDYPSALIYAKECLYLTKKWNVNTFYTSLYTQLSSLNVALGHPDSALYYADLALVKNEEFSTGEMERGYALLAKAEALNGLREYEEVEAIIDSAIGCSNRVRDRYALIYAKNALARYYHGLNRHEEAWDVLRLAMQQSLESDALSGLRFSLHTAVELSRAEDDFKLALMYTDSLHAMTNNLLNDDFEFIALANKFREEQAELISLKQKMTIDDLTLQRNTALLFLTLLVAFGAGIAWFFQFRANQRVRKMNTVLEDRNKMISKQNTQLDEQTKALIENQRLLKKLNADKDKLLTLISHDLRSPVAQVKSIAELVLKGALEGEELKAFFERINESADKSLANLTEVLVWARSQMDKGMSSNLEVVEVSASIEHAFQIVESDYDSKGVIFTRKVPEPSPKVYCDESHLGIILRNLLSNAVKFSHRGGEVQVRVRTDGAWVHFMVEDRGVGMSEEVRQKIFDHGERHTAQGTENESGTGTGLQLVREFVQANGGHLEITSTLGEGTSIGVSFRKA